jgi:hypothetical protein
MVKRSKTVAHFVMGTSRVEITLDRAALPQPAFPAGYVSFTGSIDGGSGQIVDDLREDAYHLKHDDPALDAIVACLARLDGQRIDQFNETGAELDDCPFSNADDMIDSRDVIARIEYLRTFVEDNPDHDDARHELTILETLEDEASGYAADWRHGETLIRDSYFEDYARELAEDIGSIQRDATWPNNHIDWPAAADELKGDYTSVTFDGVDYWIR